MTTYESIQCWTHKTISLFSLKWSHVTLSEPYVFLQLEPDFPEKVNSFLCHFIPGLSPEGAKWKNCHSMMGLNKPGWFECNWKPSVQMTQFILNKESELREVGDGVQCLKPEDVLVTHTTVCLSSEYLNLGCAFEGNTLSDYTTCK